MQKNTNILLRSKTPLQKGSYRNLRNGTSPIRNIKIKPSLSKSPIKNTSKIKTDNLNKSKISSNLQMKEKQLKSKIKLLTKENESLQKILDKCDNDKKSNIVSLENEKNQILEVFIKFVLKKKIKLSLHKRSASTRKNSLRDTSKTLFERKSSQSTKKLSFTKKSSRIITNNSYVEVDKKPLSNDKMVLLMKKEFDNKRISSNVKLLERFGIFDS
jgi:hypothetical protein